MKKAPVEDVFHGQVSVPLGPATAFFVRYDSAPEIAGQQGVREQVSICRVEGSHLFGALRIVDWQAAQTLDSESAGALSCSNYAR